MMTPFVVEEKVIATLVPRSTTNLQQLIDIAIRDSGFSSLNGDKNLDLIIENLKSELNPTHLFLYGSRANGTALPDSDYDFVMAPPQFDKNL